ncbi:2-C-methyl-D-erythritol 2,4-cyclodiphosphate synthase [subsurface metagenome]|nr:2-C-methyl-D-erythritol 2,4-cyclodiphosphate synthase [bacterium]
MKIRTGIGYDVHRLEEGRKLFLGGVEIDFPKGLKGHSDGDCLTHAIIDALLGAAGRDDIGQLFPDTDPQYKDMRSTELLKKVMDLIRERGMAVVNIDSIVIAENPKLAPYIPRMKEVLCPILGMGKEDLGIKAKTNEGLGAIGKEEAIASLAQALIREKP